MTNSQNMKLNAANVVKVTPLRPAMGKTVAWPARMTDHAAGWDLCACVDAPLTLQPGQRALVPCGFAMEMPAHIEAQVRPRSGLALKHGITCLNAPGTIDADYRGEVGVLLINHGDAPFVIEAGLRIAQLVFAEVYSVGLEVVSALGDSARGAGGFGSTGGLAKG